MSLDHRAQILQTVEQAPLGIRDIARILEWKTSNVVSLVRMMHQERLIEFQLGVRSKRGRPKKNVTCTAVGLEFLETYRRLKMKPIRARKEDLERASKDALYAKRLVADGHSLFTLFMELNMIASNIKKSSETHQTI